MLEPGATLDPGLPVPLAADPRRDRHARRADGKPLGHVWHEIDYHRATAQMIRAGYLTDVRGVRVGLEQVKLDEVEQSGGDEPPPVP